MSIYKVGVIGCGRIASLMEQDEHRDKPTTHAGCYDVVQRTQMVAAADSHEDRLQGFGRRWNVQQLYSSYEEMVNNEDLDMHLSYSSSRHHYEGCGIRCKSHILREGNGDLSA